MSSYKFVSKLNSFLSRAVSVTQLLSGYQIAGTAKVVKDPTIFLAERVLGARKKKYSICNLVREVLTSSSPQWLSSFDCNFSVRFDRNKPLASFPHEALLRPRPL